MPACAFRWLTTGDDAFADMLAAVGAAQRSVRLETYHYAAGGVGERCRAALIQASQRGARVQILVDAFGSVGLSDRFWDPVRGAGGEMRWFNPLSFARLTFRDHRKLLICDEQVAYVGGFNIAPEYEGDGVQRGWRDTGLRVEGALARELADAFDGMFLRASQEHLPLTRWRRSTSRAAIACEDGEILLSGPGRGKNAIKRSLLADLARAREVRIAAAYFLPSGKLRRSLTRVARRGGRVQLILAGRSDVALSQLASRNLYQRFLRSGIDIYEYQPQVLHTKLLVIDEATYVGSSNLDTRSLHINYELMLRLVGSETSAGARRIFDDHLAHARRILPRTWARSRTCWEKLKERWACLLLARLDPLFMRWQLRRLEIRALQAECAR